MKLANFRKIMKNYPLFEVIKYNNSLECIPVNRNISNYFLIRYDELQDILYVPYGISMNDTQIYPITRSGKECSTYDRYIKINKPNKKICLEYISNLIKKIRELQIERKIKDIQNDFV